MQNLQDIEEKIFFECKSILDSLSKINSKDELLQKQDLCYELSERIAFLKILEKNEQSFVELESNTFIDTQDKVNDEIDIQDGTVINNEEEDIEEEVAFTNELNQIDDDIAEKGDVAGEAKEIVFASEIVEEPIVEIPLSLEDIPVEISDTKFDINLEPEPIVEEKRDENIVADATEEVEEHYESNDLKQKVEEDLQKSIEESIEEKVEVPVVEAPPAFDDNWFDNKTEDEEAIHEKKFKLANIKGLKSLFDEEQLQSLENPTIGSAAKASVFTSYMESDKQKQEFKLALNDRLAFSKMLFGGSQSELNNTVNQLNQFRNAEEAKEYLSELYYEKKWDRVDEYAQRLWTLVENKFI